MQTVRRYQGVQISGPRHGLEAFLEAPPVACAGEQGADIFAGEQPGYIYTITTTTGQAGINFFPQYNQVSLCKFRM